MSKPQASHFVIDGRPVQVVTHPHGTDLLAMDPATGAMRPAPDLRNRLAGAQVAAGTYTKLLEALRQAILERLATTPIQWLPANEPGRDYGFVVDGHRLTIRVGEFPVEPLYLLAIDGNELYAIDDWPSAWRKPRH